MPAAEQHPYLREAAILTRAIDNLLRKLVRLLMGRITLTRLQEMLRLIFVQEADAYLRRESAGKSVPMTKLALLTGLDTRTLGKLVDAQEDSQPLSDKDEFLKGFAPGYKVLDTWMHDKSYKKRNSGKPAELQISGSHPSFESLVNAAVSSRGMTYSTVLRWLIQNNMVKVNERTNTIRMNTDSAVFLSNDESDIVNFGLATVCQLLTTITHNLTNIDSKTNRMFQRSCWTYKVPQEKRNSFRAHIHASLTDLSEVIRDDIKSFEAEEDSPDQITAGVSFFYFEQEQLDSVV